MSKKTMTKETRDHRSQQLNPQDPKYAQSRGRPAKQAHNQATQKSQSNQNKSSKKK